MPDLTASLRVMADCRASIELAFLALLRERFPGFEWTIVRSEQGYNRGVSTAAGEVSSTFAAEDDEHALPNRSIATAA
jgi:hypothetical protein